MGAREVGRVVGLWRYPVKSMAAEALASVEVGWHGFAGDRRWAFVRGGVPAQRLPVDDDPRGRGDARARAAVRRAGAARQVADDGADARRARSSTSSIPALGGRAGRRGAGDQAGPRRVRRDAAVADHHAGDRRARARSSASGSTASASGRTCSSRPTSARTRGSGACCGSAGCAMRVDQRDERCVIVNIDPVDGASAIPRVLRTLAQERSACIGVYGSTVQPGASRSAIRSSSTPRSPQFAAHLLRPRGEAAVAMPTTPR